jgi:hypothetical protein
MTSFSFVLLAIGISTLVDLVSMVIIWRSPELRRRLSALLER